MLAEDAKAFEAFMSACGLGFEQGQEEETARRTELLLEALQEHHERFGSLPLLDSTGYSLLVVTYYCQAV